MIDPALMIWQEDVLDLLDLEDAIEALTDGLR